MAGLFGEKVPDLVLRSLFTTYDKDGSGYLSANEVRGLLVKDLGLSESESDAFSLLMDEDGSNSISFEEFKEWIQGNNKAGIIFDPTCQKYQLLIKAAEYFREFDTDNNGAIDGQEIVKLAVSVGISEDKSATILDAIDKDQNGKISFLEFLKWLRWIPIDDS